jgi:hypothetical protein
LVRRLSELLNRLLRMLLRILLRLARLRLIALLRRWLSRGLVLLRSWGLVRLLSWSLLGCGCRLRGRSGMRDILGQNNSRIMGGCRPRRMNNWSFSGNDDSWFLLGSHQGRYTALSLSC